MIRAIAEGIALARELVKLARSGASREDIQARLADPYGPARRLVDAASATRGKLERYIKHG